MKRITLLLTVCVVFSLMLAASCTLAQVVFQDEQLTIYGGLRADTYGIKLAGWGSGQCTEAPNVGNTLFIEIMGRGLYTGGRLDFENPLDITEFFNDPNIYLQLQIRSPIFEALYGSVSEFGAAALSGSANYGAGPTGYGTGSSRSQPSMKSPIGRPLANFGVVRTITKLQIMIQLTNGVMMEQMVELDWFDISGEGWSSISIPLAALKNDLDLSNYAVKRIFIANDGTEPLDISQILLVRDTTPLEVNAGEEMMLSRNYESSFYGTSKHGISGVKYSWDFDNSDGIQEDAVGIYAFYKYYKKGEYIVTLTISDPFGIKQPAISTVKVRVIE